MANTYYDSKLTGEEIEAALTAIDRLIVPANNGKVLVIENGKIVAKSVQELVLIFLKGDKASWQLPQTKSTSISTES